MYVPPGIANAKESCFSIALGGRERVSGPCALEWSRDRRYRQVGAGPHRHTGDVTRRQARQAGPVGGDLQQIATCLDDASRDLRGGGSATRACGQLHQYAELIPETVDDTLGRERTDALREGLRDALYVRGIPGATEEQLEQLDWAAGSFAALGDFLRV
jgi:hypothetical protein